MCFTPQMELTRVGDEKTESFSSSLNFLAERNHFEKKKNGGVEKNQIKHKPINPEPNINYIWSPYLSPFSQQETN